MPDLTGTWSKISPATDGFLAVGSGFSTNRPRVLPVGRNVFVACWPVPVGDTANVFVQVFAYHSGVWYVGEATSVLTVKHRDGDISMPMRSFSSDPHRGKAAFAFIYNSAGGNNAQANAQAIAVVEIVADIYAVPGIGVPTFHTNIDLLDDGASVPPLSDFNTNLAYRRRMWSNYRLPHVWYSGDGNLHLHQASLLVEMIEDPADPSENEAYVVSVDYGSVDGIPPGWANIDYFNPVGLVHSGATRASFDGKLVTLQLGSVYGQGAYALMYRQYEDTLAANRYGMALFNGAVLAAEMDHPAGSGFVANMTVDRNTVSSSPNWNYNLTPADDNYLWYAGRFGASPDTRTRILGVDISAGTIDVDVDVLLHATDMAMPTTVLGTTGSAYNLIPVRRDNSSSVKRLETRNVERGTGTVTTQIVPVGTVADSNSAALALQIFPLSLPGDRDETNDLVWLVTRSQSGSGTSDWGLRWSVWRYGSSDPPGVFPAECFYPQTRLHVAWPGWLETENWGQVRENWGRVWRWCDEVTLLRFAPDDRRSYRPTRPQPRNLSDVAENWLGWQRWVGQFCWVTPNRVPYVQPRNAQQERENWRAIQRWVDSIVAAGGPNGVAEPQ